MKTTRLLATLIAAGLISIHAQAATPETGAKNDFSVVLLGTGTPNPSPARFGGATLVQAAGKNFLFDAGRGVTIRLWQLGIPLGKVDHVFLTHFHSDHTNGLPDLWLTGWVATAYGGRNTPLEITGPKGVKALTRGLTAAYADDIKVRIADEDLPPAGIRFKATEFNEKGGVVYDKDGVKITAFPNMHGEKIHPSVGYRIDYAGHSVVISGDTRPSPEVVHYGKGVDLLIHEVAAARPELIAENPELKPILAHHSTPEQAGQIFTETKPKMAAYSHFVFLANKKYPAMTPEDVKQATQTTYSGPLTLGTDLTRFNIGDEVTVQPWTPPAAK